MSIPKPADWTRWCDESIASMRYLRDAGPDLIALAKMPTTLPDGYRGAAGGEKVAGAGSALTNPEAHANRRGYPGTGTKAEDDIDGEDSFTPPLTQDWVMQRLSELYAHLRDARAATTRAHYAALLIEGRADGRLGRQTATPTHCQACGRVVTGAKDDKVKSGYCESNPACYSAWRRYRDAEFDAGRDPSRETFKRKRLRDLGPQRESA